MITFSVMGRTSVPLLCLLVTFTSTAATRSISESEFGTQLSGVSDGPGFCDGHECPPFKVIETTRRYQLREYEGGMYQAD